MGKLITITDKNYKEFVKDPVVGGDKKKRGLRPRDFKKFPVAYQPCTTPLDIPLIDEAEWADRIKDKDASQATLQHVRDRGNFGQRIPSLDQDGKGYCWFHSGTSAHLIIRAYNNQPYLPLSAFAGACVIKNFRDEGGWGAEGVQFQADRGVPTAEYWPMQSMDRKNDNPATWENAKLHRIQFWYDLSDDYDTARKQLATLLLLDIPVVVDYNWWGHSVCACRLVKAKPFTVRIWNSWSDSWSDNGMGDLVEQKAVPNGAVAPVVVTASLKAYLPKHAKKLLKAERCYTSA